MIVDCYLNIRNKLFSIRHKGKVVERSSFVILSRAKFVVSEAGRKRVLMTKHKNVHAFVRGELSSASDIKYPKNSGYFEQGAFKEAYYNPYITEFFIDRKTREPLHEAEYVMLLDGKIYYKT